MTHTFAHEAKLRQWDALTLQDVGRMSYAATMRWLFWNDPNGMYDEHPELTLHELHVMLWEQVKGGRS